MELASSYWSLQKERIDKTVTRLHPTTTPHHQINPCNAGAIHTGHFKFVSLPVMRTAENGSRRKLVRSLAKGHPSLPYLHLQHMQPLLFCRADNSERCVLGCWIPQGPDGAKLLRVRPKQGAPDRAR